MGILLESAILQDLEGRCSFVCGNVSWLILVTCLVIDTAVVSSSCSEDWVEATLRVRLWLRYCSYSGHIPVEGQSNDTYCAVACIEMMRMLCTGLWRMSSPIRSQAVNGGSRSRWYSVTVSKEERGRRALAAALSRHMVGRRISIGS